MKIAQMLNNKTNKKMKKRSLLLSVIAVVGLSAKTDAQSGCNLINSVTLNAQTTQSVENKVAVGYLTPNAIIFQDTSVWHYMAVTKSNQNGKLFLDGSLVYSGSFTSNPYIWNSLLFGASQNCVSCAAVPDFNGKLDEVRVSNIARSDNEISAAFLNNQPFSADVNTLGLFHLDGITSNQVSNSQGGTGSVFGNPSVALGKFGQSVNFDGIDDYIRWSQSIPVNNLTVEFWFKSNDLSGTMLMLEYAYNTGIYIQGNTVNNTLTWSTGATGNSVTVDPNQMPYVWVTDGNCTDTVWFDSQSATIYDTITTNITVYDTLLTTVTDTLIINTTLSLPAPNNENTILIYPNPASDHITIDNGNFAAMAGYTIKIENNAGQQVFQSLINQAQFYVDLSTWSGNGLYFVHLIDPQNNTVTIRKIVLQ
jgi:hypothetical protein